MPQKKNPKKNPATRPKPAKASPRPAIKAAADETAKSPAPAPKTGKGGPRPIKKPAAKAAPKPATKNEPKPAKAAPKPKAASKPAAKNEPKPAKAAPKPKAAPKCAAKAKAKGQCGSGKCDSGTCPARKQLDGRSLYDRARECKDLEECRRFIVEFNEAVEQANQWLDDMHAQALSAEEARDVYGEQISDLLEAIDIDRARIAALEADLKKARTTSPKSAATDAALDKLAELSAEVRSIRTDLKRLLEGREPTTERRGRNRRAERERTGRGRGRPPKAAAGTTPGAGRGRGDDDSLVVPRPFRAGKSARRGATVAPGAFAKYSVLRGAACSLGVGKYNYPPEVCAPASFSREEAAQILGTYAQNKYGGLAKWALITGLPIDDVAVPLPAQPRAARKAAPTSPPRRAAGVGQASRGRAPKASAERSNRQILDQVLLTLARV